jgi:hypothetical protein
MFTLGISIKNDIDEYWPRGQNSMCFCRDKKANIGWQKILTSTDTIVYVLSESLTLKLFEPNAQRIRSMIVDRYANVFYVF